jgi:hypothetical protein
MGQNINKTPTLFPFEFQGAYKIFSGFGMEGNIYSVDARFSFVRADNEFV